jgi:hypothetical protein
MRREFVEPHKVTFHARHTGNAEQYDALHNNGPWVIYRALFVVLDLSGLCKAPPNSGLCPQNPRN